MYGKNYFLISTRVTRTYCCVQRILDRNVNSVLDTTNNLYLKTNTKRMLITHTGYTKP